MTGEELSPGPKDRASCVQDSMDALELAVVVPTLNERENVAHLVKAIQHALTGHSFEIIFVDDNSPDGTADCVRELARTNTRVRCIQRIGRRGLASAFLEGALATAAPVTALIDGDMQHDEKLLPLMLENLRRGQLDIVVGSRYLEKNGFGDWSENRVRVSKLATEISKKLMGLQLSDPMSGFFMIRTHFLRSLAPRLSAVGYKILLDIFLSTPTPPRSVELPYKFRSREVGVSKLDTRVMLEFAELIIDKTVGRIIPTKFIMFSIVGSSGVLVHLTILWVVFKVLGMTFPVAQTAATLTAMISNFALNNVITYHDRRLFGWDWIRGLLTFALASSVGLIANVGVASVFLVPTKFNGWSRQWQV